jgi:hypothetical protein
MWEWISLAIGAAFLVLYVYALKCGREKTRDSCDREGGGMPSQGE